MQVRARIGLPTLLCPLHKRHIMDSILQAQFEETERRAVQTASSAAVTAIVDWCRAQVSDKRRVGRVCGIAFYQIVT